MSSITTGLEQKTAGDTLVIKLIFTTINSDVQRALTTLALKVSGKLPKFGHIHSALAVGPTIIEWNDSSLCVPRKSASTSAVIAVDIARIEGMDRIDEILFKMAQTITYWNNNKIYGMFEANCQIFVEDLLRSVGITPNFTGSLSNFIENVRKKGKCSPIYYVNEYIASCLGIKPGEKKFKAHEELDLFVIEWNGKVPRDYLNSPEGISDFMLLKAFDRAFWLKYIKQQSSNETIEEYNKRLDMFCCYEIEKRNGVFTCGCPFGDPSDTNTNYPKANHILPKQPSVVAKNESLIQKKTTSEDSANLPESFIDQSASKCVVS
jgi:hypothetical protein